MFFFKRKSEAEKLQMHIDNLQSEDIFKQKRRIRISFLAGTLSGRVIAAIVPFNHLEGSSKVTTSASYESGGRRFKSCREH